MYLEVFLIVLGILLLLDGLVLLLFPKWAKKMVVKALKNPSLWGISEIIIAVLLIAIAKVVGFFSFVDFQGVA